MLSSGGYLGSRPGLRERSLSEEALSSDTDGGFSDVRKGLSFFFMLSPCISAGDWN